jgi:protein phosphatase
MLKRFKLMGRSTMKGVDDYAIRVALASDIGCQRHNNEDAMGFFAPEGDRQTGLAIIADGMGGHKAGEVASKEAVETIGALCLAKHFLNPRQTLTEAYLEANRRIYRHAAAHFDCRGMGTTATALMIAQGSLCYAHVGDSRLYRIYDDQIAQMTQDHTLVAQMLQYGMITQEQVRTHPNRNILINSLGTSPEVQVEILDNPFPVYIGDSYLLCSDGLFDELGNNEIKRIVLTHSPEEACQALINAALDSGGRDNISVIVLAIEKQGLR